jgi:hypothetical protein
MLASAIVAEVQRIIYKADYSGDVDYDDAAILAIINRGRLEIAGGGDRQHGNEMLAPLPDLFTSDTITASAATNSVAMPADFQRGLHRVTVGGEKIKQHQTLRELLDKYEGDTGVPEGWFLKGKTLWFGPSPTSNTDMVVYYHARPTDITASEEPSEIDEHLQFRLLVNFACKEIFAEIESGMDMRSPDYVKHDALYQRALTDLSRAIGPEEKEAVNINDDYYTDENII